MEIYSICKRLKESRIKRGFLSARSFANHHKIPDSTYTQHESGKRKMSINTLIDYCNLLMIDPLWLMTGERCITPITSPPEPLDIFQENVLENIILQNRLVKIDIFLLSKIIFKTALHCHNKKYSQHNILNSCLKIYNHFIQHAQYTKDPNIDNKINNIIISVFNNR
ncbi:MAG: helix-turn-helix transcriptional regulator [Legionellales bacterium]|nr:helix-turn-helix transcriptional regulator [Legionellales bacterium]